MLDPASVPAARNPARTRRWSVLLPLVFILGLIACGDDSPSGPGPAEVVDHLDIEAPGTITPDQPFELRVIAVGSEGTRPFPGFDGEVELLVSDGNVTPSTVAVASGEGSVMAIVQTTASRVELTAGAGTAVGSVQVECARTASVSITGGRFYLTAVAEARTFSADDSVREEQEASMPQSLDFSQALTAEATATHVNVDEILVTAFGASEGNLEVHTVGPTSTEISSMTIEGGGSGVGTWDGGNSSGGAAAGVTGFVEFSFTVEANAVLANCDGTFDRTSFSLRDASNTRLLSTFNLGTVRLEPGEYVFRASLSNDTVSATGSKSLAEFSCSIEMGLSFAEVAPE